VVGEGWASGPEKTARAFFLPPRRVTTSSRRDCVGDGGGGDDGSGGHRSTGSNSSRSRGRGRHLETTAKRADQKRPCSGRRSGDGGGRRAPIPTTATRIAGMTGGHHLHRRQP